MYYSGIVSRYLQQVTNMYHCGIVRTVDTLLEDHRANTEVLEVRLL
jgi:hypothetical protein